MWRARGKHVCRHGVFFEITGHAYQCNCLNNAIADRWQAARFMPAIDDDLHMMVAVDFDDANRQTVQQLHYELRRQDGD